MIKLCMVSMLLYAGICCASDTEQSREQDDTQDLMQTFLSKSQQEQQDIIDLLHRLLKVHIYQIDQQGHILYNGTVPEHATPLGDVMHAMLAEQYCFNGSLAEHTKLLNECRAHISKLSDQCTSFEHRTEEILKHIDGRISNIEAGMSGLEVKVDGFKQLLRDIEHEHDA